MSNRRYKESKNYEVSRRVVTKIRVSSATGRDGRKSTVVKGAYRLQANDTEGWKAKSEYTMSINIIESEGKEFSGVVDHKKVCVKHPVIRKRK